VSESGGAPAVALDPRARRSKAALEGALLELVAVRDLSQISISDITKRAGISRSTFYEHYADVHDLAASVCTIVFDELVADQPMFDPRIVGSGDLATPRDNPLVTVFAHFAGHAQLYRSLLGPDGSALVINHLLHRMTTGAYTNLRTAAPAASTHADDPSDTPYDPEAALLAGALAGTVIDWLKHGCPGTAQDLAATVWPMLVGVAAANGLGALPPRQP
jgi:AcrR family transcriptional regulator